MAAVPVASAPLVGTRDAFNYKKANEPRGIEKPLRTAQAVVSNPNDWITWNIPAIATLKTSIEAPSIARWLRFLPGFLHGWLTAFANGPIARFCNWLTKIRGYNAFSSVLFNLTSVAGLVLAPFDIKNMLNLWKDKKAFLGHKVTFSVEVVSGIVMSLFAVASFGLGRFGLAGLATKAYSLAMMAGGVQMVASLPEMAVGAYQGAVGLGKKNWHFFAR